jgi:hypothetical protein
MFDRNAPRWEAWPFRVDPRALSTVSAAVQKKYDIGVTDTEIKIGNIMTPTDFYPIEQVQMMRFIGEKWQLFGPIIDGHAGYSMIRKSGNRFSEKIML